METYWSRRNEYLDSLAMSTSDDMIGKMSKRYASLNRAIEREIEAFVGRYAKDSNITIREANKLLDNGELLNFKKNLIRYQNVAENLKGMSPLTRKRIGAYTERLKKLSTRLKISRLKVLETTLEQYAVEMGIEQDRMFNSSISESMNEAYQYSNYELDIDFGYHNALSTIQFENLMKVDWMGGSFSSRIWKDKDNLLNNLHTTLLQGIAMGHNPRKIAGRMSRNMNSSYKACERLARTEVLHFFNESTTKAYREYGVNEYRYVASLDERTCEICGALDGKIFKIDEAVEGINYPVMHPNCRCSTIPYYAHLQGIGEKSTRFARDENGRAIEVSEDMTYEEWKKIFID